MTEQPVAIVTASGQGIGAAIARELHARGWRLALMSRSENAENLANELGAVGLVGSVTDPDALAEVVACAMDRYGRIDGVVNNTGHPPKGPLLDLTDDDWHAGLDMVVLNVVRMTRLVCPIMQEQGGGTFVNVSTFAAFEPDPLFPISSALRAGLAGFTKLFSDRYAEQNIRMNNVLPGFIDNMPVTDMKLERTPMRRLGRVEEIAKTVAFLLSSDSGFITGQNLRADGGLTRSI
ncbi:MAG: SDR family oxidoreductase [Rhodospirillales bacterium]|jgi:NAD(P)-dependent dehydrogenase (short-subunit alcohol dehydrogenase family)|nr:SDR family oxidoreductase [Rhodospirillales bacterium]